MSLPKETEVKKSLVGEPITGVASFYDQTGRPTSTKEFYSRTEWTAAIQQDLRHLFGGVNHKNGPGLALVEYKGKDPVVLKITNVGPLAKGRVIDLAILARNHFFGDNLEVGLLKGVTVTPLYGKDYKLGPITSAAELAAIKSGLPQAIATADKGFTKPLPKVTEAKTAQGASSSYRFDVMLQTALAGARVGAQLAYQKFRELASYPAQVEKAAAVQAPAAKDKIVHPEGTPAGRKAIKSVKTARL